MQQQQYRMETNCLHHIIFLYVLLLFHAKYFFIENSIFIAAYESFSIHCSFWSSNKNKEKNERTMAENKKNFTILSLFKRSIPFSSFFFIVDRFHSFIFVSFFSFRFVRFWYKRKKKKKDWFQWKLILPTNWIPT